MTQLAILHAQNKVETQNLASHEQGYAMNRGEYMYVVVANFLGRHKILRLYLAGAKIILMQNSRARQHESRLLLRTFALSHT